MSVFVRLTRIVRATSGLALGSFVLLLLGPSWVTDADEFSHWYEAPPASVHRFVGRVCLRCKARALARVVSVRLMPGFGR